MSDLPRGSLGGQNSHRRVSSARSSRALSAIFKRLRAIDRRISAWNSELGWYKLTDRIPVWQKKYNELDAKRREVRLMRKGYE